MKDDRTEKAGLLTPEAVANMLGLSKPHIYNLAKSGELPSVKFGRAVRFEAKEVEAFIQAHRRQGKAGSAA